jgi:hypothetical protein
MRLLWLGLLLPWLTPAGALAQSSFNGTWKIDLTESPSPAKPENYLLQNGIYRCSTCDPAVEIQADGRDHQISGEACYDTVSVQVIDDKRTLETDKKNGKPVGTVKITVSSDSNTSTREWTESCNANGDVVSGTDILSRVTKGPSGSHAISGSWLISKRVNRSENALVITLKLEGDIFSFVDPAGQGYTARLDGTETPFKGDLSGTVVSVKRISADTIEETDRRSGEIEGITRFVISADGKTMTVSIENQRNKTTRKFILHKQ